MTFAARNAFQASVTNRLTQHLPTICEGATEELRIGTLGVLRARSRYLYNNCIAKNVVNTIVRRVVGKGIQFYSDMQDAEGNYLRAENQQVTKLFTRFMNSASKRGHKAHAFLRHMFRSYLRDGEVFLLKIDNPQGEFFRQYQIIEGDQIAENYSWGTLPNVAQGNIVNQGIETTPEGDIVAYHVYNDGYDSYWFSDKPRTTRRIPADRIIHWSNGNRYDSPRGIPLLTPVILDIADLEEFRKAALTQAWVQACFAAFITTKNPQSAAMLLGDQNSEGETQAGRNTSLDGKPLGNGTISVLDRDSSVEFADPKSPGGTFDPFTKNVLRSIAATVGISYIALTRDFSETTYSGGRQADNEDRITYEDFAEDMDSEVLKPIYADFIKSVFFVNRLMPVPAAVDLYSVKIIHPTPREIDPVKEQTAYAAADALQIISPQEICAKLGRSFHDVMDQRLEANLYRMKVRLRVMQAAREEARLFNATALDYSERITMRELAYVPDMPSISESLSTSVQNEKTTNGDDPTNA